MTQKSIFIKSSKQNIEKYYAFIRTPTSTPRRALSFLNFATAVLFFDNGISPTEHTLHNKNLIDAYVLSNLAISYSSPREYNIVILTGNQDHR